MKQVDHIRYTVLSADQWRMITSCVVCNPINQSSNYDGTVYDTRMGSLERTILCKTCGMNNVKCVGHFGIIELPEPMWNPLMISYIHMILSCICDKCFNIRIKNIDQYKNKNGYIRLKLIYKQCIFIRVCFHCSTDEIQTPLYKYSITQDKKHITEVYPDGNLEYKYGYPVIVSAKRVYSIFLGISDETMINLGFNNGIDNPYHINRPESFLFTVFPVIPPIIRSYVIREEEQYEDYITTNYNNIVKLICKISGKDKKKNKISDVDKQKYIKSIQEFINIICDNTKNISISHNNNTAKKGLVDRFSGKHGHIKNNVVSKRVNFSARTVIDAGPSLFIDEIGIPGYISKKLTVPVEVTKYNIEELCDAIMNRKINYVKRKTKNGSDQIFDVYFSTKCYTSKFNLEVGDIVERHLIDGDYVIFNRQPTLRKESMLGFKVKIYPLDLCIRISLACTIPFNADFDGDESNIHLPQSEKASTEVKVLLNIKNHILSEQHNSPIIGIKQDGLIGAYILTNIHSDGNCVMIPWTLLMDCAILININWIEFIDRVMIYYPEYIDKYKNKIGILCPGKILLSMVFPSFLFYKKYTDVNKSYPDVIIERGIIIPNSGPLCNSCIGPKHNSIQHKLWLISPTYASNTLSYIQFITDKFLCYYSFTMNLSSCLIPIGEDKYIIDDDIRTIIQNNTDENIINIKLNKIISVGIISTEKHISTNEYNFLNIMMKSGSKGNVINCTQITNFIGQQNVEGCRIKPTLCGMKRTLPYFISEDKNVESRGFIKSSFISGLNLTEQFFQACGGREGIINTALKTSETGYIQKRMGEKTKNYIYVYDGSVRDITNGRIIQFLYGGDGYDPKYIFKIKNNKYMFFVDIYLLSIMLNDTSTDIPIKLIEHEYYNDIFDIITSKLIVGSPGLQSDVTILKTNIIRDQLKDNMKEVKISADKIPLLCKHIYMSFIKSQCTNGEMVGLNSTTALGEPTTQMTLNTFHMAGNSAKDVTLGVPRLNELLNATKSEKQKTPSITIYFNSPKINYLKCLGNDDEIMRCMMLLDDFGYCKISDVVTNIKLKWVDKLIDNPINFIKYEKYEISEWENIYYNLYGKPAIPSYWIIELSIDISNIMKIGLDLKKISKIIENESNGHIKCVYSPIIYGKIICIYDFYNLSTVKYNKLKSMYTQDNLPYFLIRESIVKYIENIHLKGINGIKSVNIRKVIDSNEWVFDTISDKKNYKKNNLITILGHKLVNYAKTISNNAHEMYETFGIEAARYTLINEIIKSISFDGTYVDPRHISLLVDGMTQSGIITSVTDYGIDRTIGPIAKATFERQTTNYTISSLFGEKDNLNGLSANITMGHIGKFGTGTVNIEK